MSRVLRFIVALAILTLASGTLGKAAAGDVVLMPDRDALMGTPLVVWGNTNPSNAGAAYTINFGDASSTSGTVTDASYIAVNHTYATPGVKTVTMTIGSESDTATVEVFDGGTLSAENQRNIGINMAIEDGLRFLYVSQQNRQAAYMAGSKFTHWTSFSAIYGSDIEFITSYTSLIVLAMENHGHSVTDDPTQDIFQPVVQRGLNFLFDNLQTIGLGPQNGNDPCAGLGADCVGLGRIGGGHSMYASAVITLAVAGSGAPAALVGAGIGAANGGYVVGRSYAEILQRQANTIVWGLGDSGSTRGGFGYVHNNNQGDGSTAGWGVLALLDAEAGGATLPVWARTDVANYANTGGLNSNGSLKYQVGMGDNQSNFAKTGIALQVQAFIGTAAGDAKVVSAEGLLSANWAFGYSTDPFDGSNKGHAYGMFNAFKGLKLYGVQTLPGVGRPAGPGSILANDWHADYQDFLVANQIGASNPAQGNFNFPKGWSYCGTCDLGGGPEAFTAIAELILSPTALVLPAHLTLSPLTATNQLPGENTHTVTAVATSTSGSFVPGATVTFTVTAGPNAGATGTDVTDNNGEATFTYTYTSAVDGGTDTIVATIGDLTSNTVSKIWLPANHPPTCPATPIQQTLWPPNHQFVTIALGGAVDPDGDTLTLTATSIMQDEPLTGSGQGAGNTAYDGILSPVQVRAERNGNPKTPGNGRVYYIDFTATDPSGASCTGQIQVCVPHDQGGSSSCIADGKLFQSTQ